VTYQQDLDKRETELAVQHFENESRRGWTQILQLYPLNDHTANYLAVKEYCDPLPISVGGYRLMLDNPRAAASLDLTDNTKRIIDEIIGLLRERGSYTDIDLKNQKSKLRFMTKTEIRARRDEIVEKQRLSKLSSTAIRQELKANRPVLQVKVLPAHITKAAIHAMDSNQVRRLIREYTAAVVNNRLFGRD
jgi:hypothetical protein